MGNYSKGIISIPEVTGDVVITVTTEGQAVNLFDPSKATYNGRIKGTGEVVTGANGIVVTAAIDVRSLTTLTVSGITEVVSSGYGYYAVMCAYSDSAGTTISGSVKTYKTEPQYTFDVSSASYVRLGLVLSSSEISAEDTANLVITGK